jgi:hypothetical protein
MAVDETNPRFQAVLGVASRLLAASAGRLGIGGTGTGAIEQSVEIAVKLVDKVKEQVLDLPRRK